VVRP